MNIEIPASEQKEQNLAIQAWREEVEVQESLDIKKRETAATDDLVGRRDKQALKRIGIAKNEIETPQNLDADNDKIAAMFGGDE